MEEFDGKIATIVSNHSFHQFEIGDKVKCIGYFVDQNGDEVWEFEREDGLMNVLIGLDFVWSE